MSTTTRRANGEGSAPRQRKDGTWTINVRHVTRDGVAKRTSVYGKTAAEARRKAKELRKRLEEGLPAKDAKVSVGAYTEEWIASSLAASDRKASTKATYTTLARKHIVDSTLGNRTLDRLLPSHVEAWVVELRNRKLSAATVRQVHTILRSVLDSAVRDEALGKNPASAVRRPKAEHREATYLTPAQARSLLDAVGDSRVRPLVEVLLHTGLRRGEALALRWSDVDFTNHTMRVRGTLNWVGSQLVITEPKTEKSRRVIHMTETCEAILRRVKVEQNEARLTLGRAWTDTGLVFTTEAGTPRDPRNALRTLKLAVRRAGLPDTVGMHTLRHSAASTMLAAGVPLKVVSDVLGHSSVSITGDIYGHVSPEVSATAMERLSAAFA